MQRLRTLFILVVAGVCLASLAANAPLIDPDEGLHAAIAQEMLLRHDLVTPTFLGEPFLDKPVLFFWAEAASLEAFGRREAAVRIPPLLFGALGAWAIALLGARLFGPRSGYAAGLVYATMLLPVGVSEVAVHDIALIPFLAAACYGVWRAAEDARPWRWAILIGLLLGLSVLTKGLVGVVFVGIFGVCVAVSRPAVFGRLLIVGLASAAVAAIVAAPWYIAMERAHPGYLHYYFIERHVEGYLTSTQRHAGREWWYYLGIVGGGAAPWIVFTIDAARDLRDNTVRRIVAAWFAIGLVFLSLGESKLATYALPVFPALAIAFGDYVTRASERPRRRGFVVAFTIATTLAAMLPLIAQLALYLEFGFYSPARLTISALAAAGIVLLVVNRWKKPAGAGAIESLAAGTALAIIAVLLTALPAAARQMTARDLAALLNEGGSLPPKVFVLDERIGSVVFYLSPALRAQAAPDRFVDSTLSGAFERLRVEPPDAVLAVRDSQLTRVQRLLPGVSPDAHAGTYNLFRFESLRNAAARQ